MISKSFFSILITISILTFVHCNVVSLPYMGDVNIDNVGGKFKCDELECDNSSTRCTIKLSTDVIAKLRAYEATCWTNEKQSTKSKVRHENIENYLHNETLTMEFERDSPNINIHGSIDGKNINLQFGRDGWVNGKAVTLQHHANVLISFILLIYLSTVDWI